MHLLGIYLAIEHFGLKTYQKKTLINYKSLKVGCQNFVQYILVKCFGFIDITSIDVMSTVNVISQFNSKLYTLRNIPSFLG